MNVSRLVLLCVSFLFRLIAPRYSLSCLQVIIAVVIGLYVALHTLMSYSTYTSIEELTNTCSSSRFRAQMKLPSPRPWVRKKDL